MQSITLYCREGSSDKVYQLSLNPKGGGFSVDFAFGRRGSTLNTGTKTPTPVSQNQAQSLFDKLVREKTAKGYQPGSESPQCTPTDRTHTGIHCQLLNPVDDVEDLLNDCQHWMQEKLDGRRLLIRKDGDRISGINRLGLTVSLPASLLKSLAASKHGFLVDGEAVGETFHAFDLLSAGGEDIRHQRFADRYFHLRDLFRTFGRPFIRLVPTYCFPEKAEWFQRFKAEGKEGVVFKDIDAPYTSGRPNSGGPQLKHKFYETASFIVTKQTEKRSVSLILFNEGRIVKAGNVTIPANHEIPSSGKIVECRYLYAFKESGSIYQPVYLGPREDVKAEECTTTQLKYKAAVMSEAA